MFRFVVSCLIYLVAHPASACFIHSRNTSIFYDAAVVGDSPVVVDATAVSGARNEGEYRKGDIYVSRVLKGDIGTGLIKVRFLPTGCDLGFARGQFGFVRGDVIIDANGQMELFAETVTGQQIGELIEKLRTR